MRSRYLVDIVVVVIVLVSTIPALAEDVIKYHEAVFRLGESSFYINITYIFRNLDPH